MLAIDTGPVVSYIQRVFLSFLSPFLPLLLSFGEPTLARFGDLLSFLPPLLTTPLRANCVFPASDSLGYYPLMLAIGRGIFFPSFFSFFLRSFEKLKARCSLINIYSLPRKDLRLDSILRRIDSKQLEVRQLFSPRLCPPFTNPGLDCDGFIRLDVINLSRVQRDLSSARRK